MTRPEGPLLAALCFGWFVIQRMADTGRLNPDWRRLICLAAPVAVLVGVHMAYVMRIGGDHFEYRPLDFYWPLLYY